MANWIQRFFLALLLVSSIHNTALANSRSGSMSELDSEQFEIGFTTGFISIQDFSSEMLVGFHTTFHSTENAFLQLNYFQANAGLSSFEKSQGALFSGDDRDFRHVDFLFGYNLFQAEQFFMSNEALLSSLYLVGGVGDTKFGGEQSFTVTLGVGYKVDLSRSMILRMDYRTHLFDSSLLEEDDSTMNAQFSVAMSYLF